MIDKPIFIIYNKCRETALAVSHWVKFFILLNRLCCSTGGYFFMTRTITVTKKAKQIMYSIITPPFTEVSKQPPPFLYRVNITYLKNHFNIFLF